jgi:hypothetical protein
LLPIINSKIGETVGASFFSFLNNYHKIISTDDINNMINDIIEKEEIEDISLQEPQEKISKKISKKMRAIEPISASEIAQKYRARITKGEELWDYLSIYLGSLNLEVLSSIMKAWKSEEDNSWFFEYLGKKVPKQYLTAKMLKAMDT